LPEIVDANILVAWSNANDPDHDAARLALKSLREVPLVAAMALAEATYLIASRVGPRAEAALVRALVDFQIEAPSSADLYRVAELMEQYADWPLGAADASIVALAERLYIDTIVTFDRRHFGAVKPRHVEFFRVLPE
jgi:predicted nucleic acid-binding protein